MVGLANSTHPGSRLGFFDEILSLLVAEQPGPRTPFRPAGVGADKRQKELVGTWEEPL